MNKWSAQQTSVFGARLLVNYVTCVAGNTDIDAVMPDLIRLIGSSVHDSSDRADWVRA